MEKFNRLADQLAKETGVDPRLVYCNATGMIVGSLTEDCCTALLASCTPADDDQMMDELLIRTLSSTRPSPAWNMFERKTLDRLRLSNPKLLLTYLLNRLYQPLERKGDTALSYRANTAYIHQRIRTYGWVQKMEINPVQLNKILLVLLELDVRWSLTRLAMPKNIPSIWASQSPESIDNVIVGLYDWLQKLLAIELEAIKKQKESDRSFTHGNKLANVAFMQQYIRERPLSERKINEIQKEAVKQESLSWLDQLEKELMQQSMNEAGRTIPNTKVKLIPPVAPTTVARHNIIQTTVKPLRFGVKAS